MNCDYPETLGILKLCIFATRLIMNSCHVLRLNRTMKCYNFKKRTMFLCYPHIIFIITVFLFFTSTYTCFVYLVIPQSEIWVLILASMAHDKTNQVSSTQLVSCTNFTLWMFTVQPEINCFLLNFQLRPAMCAISRVFSDRFGVYWRAYIYSKGIKSC